MEVAGPLGTPLGLAQRQPSPWVGPGIFSITFFSPRRSPGPLGGWMEGASLPPLCSPPRGSPPCPAPPPCLHTPPCLLVFELERPGSGSQAVCVHVAGRYGLGRTPCLLPGGRVVVVVETQLAQCVDGQMDTQMIKNGNTAWSNTRGWELSAPHPYPPAQQGLVGVLGMEAF